MKKILFLSPIVMVFLVSCFQKNEDVYGSFVTNPEVCNVKEESDRFSTFQALEDSKFVFVK